MLYCRRLSLLVPSSTVAAPEHIYKHNSISIIIYVVQLEAIVDCWMLTRLRVSFAVRQSDRNRRCPWQPRPLLLIKLATKSRTPLTINRRNNIMARTKPTAGGGAPLSSTCPSRPPTPPLPPPPPPHPRLARCVPPLMHSFQLITTVVS